MEYKKWEIRKRDYQKPAQREGKISNEWKIDYKTKILSKIKVENLEKKVKCLEEEMTDAYMQIDWLTDQVNSLIYWSSSASGNPHSSNYPE